MMSPEKSSLNEITRESLYERVWQTPAATLAAEWNISGPALAKRCKKLNVPVPPRGYWARLAAGAKLKKTPLPPSPEELVALALKEPIPTSVPADAPPHPISTLLLQSLLRAKPDREKRLSVKNVQLPQVIVTETMIEPAVQALEIIITALEKRGIPFRKARSKYDSAFFERGMDRLYFKIEEPLVVSHRKLTISQRRSRGWSGELYAQEPTKELAFSIDPATYFVRPLKTWTSDSVQSYRHTAAQVVTGICDYFQDLETKRAQKEREGRERAERHAEWERERQAEENERRRKDEEIQRAIRERENAERHAATINRITAARVFDLLKAAEWWRIANTTHDFIHQTVERWKTAQSGALTVEQEQWQEWAFNSLNALLAGTEDYPVPERDGGFDAEKMPIGGPYPLSRNFPRPPSFPETPPPPVHRETKQTAPVQVQHTPPPYPFWLKYGRR